MHSARLGRGFGIFAQAQPLAPRRKPYIGRIDSFHSFEGGEAKMITRTDIVAFALLLLIYTVIILATFALVYSSVG